MNKLVRLKSWQLFLILFVPFPLQVATGIGLEVGSFIIGAFPAMIIYCIWIQALLIEFEKKLQIQAVKVIGIKATKSLMIITLFVAIPLYWILVNFMFNNPQDSLYTTLGIPFVFYFLYAAIRPWIALSKAIHILLNNSNYLIEF